MTKNATLSYDGKSYELPVVVGTEDETAVDISHSAREIRPHHARQRLREHRRLHEQDHLHRRRERNPALSRLSGRRARRAVELRRDGVSPDLRRAADRHAARGLPATARRARVHPRGHAASLRRLPARRAADGDPVGDDQRGRLLPAGIHADRGQRPLHGARGPAHEQGPHDRGRELPEVDRQAGQLPAHRAALHGEPAAHDVLASRIRLYQPDEVVVRALDQLLLLHADHEQNCSTSTVRMVGSSQANLYASVAAGVCALWGPLHGGANVAVMEMLAAAQGQRREARDVHREA